MRHLIEEILKTGRLLFEEGLVGGRAGNISYAYRDRLLITRTGALLSDLSEEDIIEVPLEGEGLLDGRASSELIVHREILKKTARRAVVHAHPVHAISLSFTHEVIKPIDSEGYMILREVPVIAPQRVSASPELARVASEALKSAKVVVVRSHGAFAVGDSPTEAYSYLSTLEHSSRIILLVKSKG